MTKLDTFLERRRKMSYSSKAMAEDEEEESLFTRPEQTELSPSRTKRTLSRFGLGERKAKGEKKGVEDQRRRLKKKRPSQRAS